MVLGSSPVAILLCLSSCNFFATSFSNDKNGNNMGHLEVAITLVIQLFPRHRMLLRGVDMVRESKIANLSCINSEYLFALV